MKANGYNTGIASEYYIASLLFRQGYEAYISSGNMKSVDIRVIKNSKAISIDVKAVQGYSSLIVNNVTEQPDHFIVFVIYNDKFDDVTTIPEVFVVPSDKIKDLAKVYGDQKRIFKSKLTEYKNNWQCLFEASNIIHNEQSINQ